MRLPPLLETDVRRFRDLSLGFNSHCFFLVKDQSRKELMILRISYLNYGLFRTDK